MSLGAPEAWRKIPRWRKELWGYEAKRWRRREQRVTLARRVGRELQRRLRVVSNEGELLCITDLRE